MDNYKEDVEIDFHRLHENYRDQSHLFMYWAEKWANADEAKKLRARQVDLDVRDNPEKYGLKNNPAEAAVKAKIDSDKEYIKLRKDAAVLASVKTAMEHRKSSLDGLTKLFVIGYFTIPNLPKEIRDAVDELGKQSIKDERKKMLEEEGSPRLVRLLKRKNN